MSDCKRLAIMGGLLFAFGTGVSASAQDNEAEATTAPSEMSALFACQAETDATIRLACFDLTVTALKAANTSGDLLAVSRGDVETVERDAFGFNLPSLRGLFGGDEDTKGEPQIEKADPIDRVSFDLDRWEKLSNGRYRFYLANGQVWSQTETDKITRPRKAKDGSMTVEIRKGSLGSFMLKVNGKGRSVRVRRTQ